MGMTYEDAKALLGKRRSRWLEYVTKLVDVGECIHVMVYSTNIITIFRNGFCVLNSGRQRTALMKRRINKYMPGCWGDNGWHVFSWMDRWFFTNGGPVAYFFSDGMLLSPDGTDVYGGYGNLANPALRVPTIEDLKKGQW